MTDLGIEVTEVEPLQEPEPTKWAEPGNPMNDRVISVVVPEPTPDFEAKVAEADSILDAIMSRIGTADNKSKYLKVLLYGMPGTGKTVLAATAPAPLVVDVEKGSFSINNHASLRDKVKVLEFKSIFQVEQLIGYLGKDEPRLADIETLVIDSFSELQKRDLDEVVRAEAAKDSMRNKYLPIGADYNVNTEHMRQIASAMRDLDRHIIVTCHVKEEKDDNTGRLLVRPNLTPKLAGTLAGIFDVVGYLNTQDGVRTLQVHPTPTVTAKTRIGNLPAIIENPKFDDLLTAFNNHKD